MRGCRPLSGLSLLLVASSVLSVAFAQGGRGLSVKVGEADLFPSLRIDYVSKDNAFLDNDDAVESRGVLVKPTLELLATRRLFDVTLAYSGDYGSFDEDVLNYDDHRLSLAAGADLATRHRVKGLLSIKKEHEDFGLNFTRLEPLDGAEQVEFTTIDLSAVHSFGASNAKGNVETGILFRNRNYLNLDSLTSGFDYSQVTPSVAFTYRLSSSARALLGFEYSVFSFDESDRDRNDAEVFAGIRLAEDRKTSGSARLGVSNSDFATAGREDVTTLTLDVGLVYRPVSFSEFRLNVDRSLDNFDGVASAAASAESIRDTFELQWIHEWSTRLGSNAFVKRTNVSRDCPDVDTATTKVGFEFSVSIRQFLSVGAGINQSERSDSSCTGTTVDPDVNDDFDSTEFGVFLKAKL